MGGSQSYTNLTMNFNWDELLTETDKEWKAWTPTDVNRCVLATLSRSVPRKWTWSGDCFDTSKNKATNRKWYFDMCVIGVVAHFVKKGHVFSKAVVHQAISRIDAVSVSATQECFAAPGDLSRELSELKAALR